MAKIYLGTTEITKAYLGSSALGKLNIGGEDIPFGDDTPQVWTIIDAQNGIPVNIGTANMGDIVYRGSANFQVKITLPATKDGLIYLDLLDSGGGSKGVGTSFKSVGTTIDWTQFVDRQLKITKSAELELTVDIA